jgi:hypothetical protein
MSAGMPRRPCELDRASLFREGARKNFEIMEMHMMTRRMLAGVALLAAISASAAFAQQAVRVRGTIEKVDGNTLTVKAGDGTAVTLMLTSDAAVVSVVKATLADVKEGSFVGSAAMPQPDGSQKALEVHIFPETMRGAGEGHRPFTVPNSTMTNGTVGDMVTASDGQSLTVKYKGGDKKIVVPPGVPIVRYEIGGRSELKPGAHVTATNAVKKPDGTLEAARINVGRDGLVPQ